MVMLARRTVLTSLAKGIAGLPLAAVLADPRLAPPPPAASKRCRLRRPGVRRSPPRWPFQTRRPRPPC